MLVSQNLGFVSQKLEFGSQILGNPKISENSCKLPMFCAGGRPKPKHFHCTMNVAVINAGGGWSLAGPAAAVHGDDGEEPSPQQQQQAAA